MRARRSPRRFQTCPEPSTAAPLVGGSRGDDSGNSPLSITEIPHLRAAVGCCGDYFVIGERTAFLVASERARWLRIR